MKKKVSIYDTFIILQQLCRLLSNFEAHDVEHIAISVQYNLKKKLVNVAPFYIGSKFSL